MLCTSFDKTRPFSFATTKTYRKKWHRLFLLIVLMTLLEPRILSAAPIAGTPNEISFIDTGVAGWEVLRDGTKDGIEVILIDDSKNGLDQIAKALDGRTNISAIHIVSHGGDGEVKLGSLVLDANNIDANAVAFTNIGKSLTPDGDILLYGCNVAEGDKGNTFISKLALRTGADIAASTDLTGATVLGGNWALEALTGIVLGHSPLTERAKANFNGTLQLVNGGVDGIIGWDAIASNANIAGASTGQTGGVVISVNNLRASGFDVYAKNDASGSSTNFLMRELIAGMTGGTSSPYVRVNTATGFTPQWLELRANEGIFDLGSIKVGSADNITALTYNFTLQALDSSFNPTGTAVTLNSVAKLNYGLFSVASNTDFDGIYGVRITVNMGTQIVVDDIEVTSPRTPNTAPVFANLDTDTVAWAGVGNTVTLDNGGNASLTDTELNALNSGNGNWGGASLTVQRPTAVTSDNFGFSASGLFSVSGTSASGNLQSGGLTFATYANAGGVLTISFTSSGTTATTALVNDVAQHITYQNNTPAGDASIRFTLNDGTVAGTAANVTVTSDTIYVTQATDTATINAANGVSFSEAIAIAAADATGTQTIVIDSSLAGQTIASSSATTLGESLTLNLDLASGVTLSGGTLSIGSGFILTTTNGAGDTATISTTLSGLGGFTKTGSGTVTLSNASNSYSGVTSISAGTLSETGGNAIGNSSAVTVSASAVLDVAAAETIGSLAGAGSVALGANTLTAGGNNTSTTFSGGIGGTGGLTKAGSGTLTLSGTNTYTGATDITVGAISVSGGNSIDNTSAVTVSSGASLLVTLGTETVGSLAGAGNVVLDYNLISGGNNSSTTFSGVISSNGASGITKNGSGMLTLSGNNTYSGSTSISAGTLSVASDANLGSGVITLNGGTLAVTGATTIDNTFNVAANSTIDVGAAVTLSGVIGGSSGLTKTGVSTLTLSNTNTYGATNVNAGTLSVASDSNLGSGIITLNGGGLTITGATTIDNSIDVSTNATIAATANATLDGVVSGAGDLTKTGASTLTLSGTNTHSGAVNVSAGGLTLIGGSSIGNTSAVTVSSGATMTLSGGVETIGSLAGAGNVGLSYTLNTGGNNTSTSFSGAISSTNTSGIVKSGSGTFTLSGANTYTGSTTINAGTLAISGGAAIANTVSVSVGSGSTFSLSSSETIGALSGSGTVQLNSNTLSSGGANVSTTFSGAINGTGNLSKTGSGTLTLSGTNGYTGATTVTGLGILSIANASNISTGTLTLGTGGTLEVTGSNVTLTNAVTLGGGTGGKISNANALTLSGVISGNIFSKLGVGTLTLSGTSDYIGATNVNAGMLLLTGTLSDTSGLIIASGAALGGTGSVFPSASSNTVIVQSGGTLAPGNSPGTFTINGNLTLGSGSTLAIEVNGTTAGTDYDQLEVTGTVDVTGANLSVTHGYTPGLADNYAIINNSGGSGIIGTFSGLVEGDTITAAGNSTVLTASYIGGTGNDFTLSAPVNAVPVIGNLSGDSVNFIENSAQVLLDASTDATVTDSDAPADFDGGNVTVSIVTNRVDTEDVLSIQNQGTSGGQIGTSGLNITYGGTIIGTSNVNGGTSSNDLVITLNSSATPAITQALVRNLIYTNLNTTTPNTATRTVRVTVNDGDGGTSSDANITVAVTAINDEPTLTATGGTPTFTEGGSAVALFSGATIDTIEAGELVDSLIFTVTNLANGSSEIIGIDGSNVTLVNGPYTTATNALDVSVSIAGSTATVTVSKTGGISTAVAQAAINGMTYTNSNVNPGLANRVVTLTSIKDNGGVLNGGADTTSPGIAATVSISAVNSAPVVTASGTVTAFTEGNNVTSTPVVIDAGVTVSDLDNTTFASATVSVTTNFQSAEDVLELINDGATMGNITPSYSSSTGVLSLTSSGASASLAEWQSALRAVTYTNNAESPTGTTRQISFVVNDGTVDSSASTQSVSVAPVDDAPFISGTPATSVSQDAAYSFTPGVVDADSGVFTFSITNKPTWASFNTATGALTGTPANANIGTTTGIVIGVTDGTTAAYLPAFDLTVTNVNDVPTITGTPATTVNQDAAYSFTPTGNDVDTGTTLVYSITNKPTWASFNTATGALTGTPANADVGTTTGIVITVSDGSLNASLVAFNLTVINVNDAPTITGTAATTASQGVAYSFVPTGNDVDTGTTLIYSITNKPTWASFNTATGALTGTPANADIGTTTGIVITVSDGSLNASLVAFNLTVNNVNDAPTITGTPAITVNQDAAYSFTPIGNDVDAGTTLVYSISNKPTWASFNTATGALTGTPVNANVGTTSGIVITVSDGSLSASLAAFNLTVINVNDAPTITGTPVITVNQDVAYSFTPTGNDVDAGTTLVYSITNKPTWASFNTATGALTGTPTNADVGTTTGIVISVSDGTLSASLSAFSLVVTNVNDAPLISGTPSISVAQDAAYSFIPTASDVDAGDVLTFSIINKPTWASFNTATGALTGTPAKADVGTTTGILISVSDGTLSANLAAFNLVVTNVNEVPVISGTPTTSVAQDAAYSFIPSASDADTGDVLTFSITNKPTWVSFNTATGALTGTPTNADVGTTTGIVISVSDGTLSASLAAFNLVVTNVNDAPVISGTPITSVNQDVAYSFIPTASDVDMGDVLTFSITNKPTWASFNTATGALTGTPAGADSGVTTGIVISVSDGTVSTSLTAFNLEVVSTVDPLQPIVTAPPAIEVNATALFTPISLRQLLSLNANATQAQVDQALKFLAVDGVNGNNCCTVMAEGLQPGNVLLVPPGHHLLKWKATNAAGITGEASQVVNVKPLVSLSKSQIAVRGSNVEFRVLLNGPSPVYPLSVPYVIDASSTATTQEHNLVAGTATFTQGQMAVVIPVALSAVTGFSDSQLVVALGDGINAGVNKRHVIDIRQGNVAPVITLSIAQGGFNTSLVTPSGGPVTVTATVTDLNPGDTHTFDWSATTGLADTDGNPSNAVRVFSPVGLSGSNQVKVTVTDSAGASVQASAYFRVIGVLPVLSPNTDTDLDGIDDDLEGTGDSDDNGIPDYLDNMPSTNILPQQGQTTNAYLIECDPGVRCGLGLFARTSTSGGVQILNDELGSIPNIEVDKVFEPVGGVFDFAIRDLPTPGQAVRVVVPQRAAIPANATYRKFQRGRWVSFVVDADNAIHSAQGNPGYCPPPGTDDWKVGLTAGHLCVQLTIKDGGPNDDDGLVNSAVVDPGAVSVAVDIPEPPKPPKPPVEIKTTGGGGSIQALWVLLLGGLLMVKRISTQRKVKGKIIAAVLGAVTILVSIATQAATGPYLRVDVANVSSSQREEDFTAALAAANYDLAVDRYDTNRSGYQLAFGYQWDQHASTEIGYLDLGEVEVDLTVTGETDLGTIPWHIGQEYPLSAEGVTLVQGLTLNPAGKFRVIGEIGVFIWRSEVDVENDVISIKRDRGEDPIVGVRFELPIQEQFGLGLGVRRIYFDTQETDLVSLTGTFRF